MAAVGIVILAIATSCSNPAAESATTDTNSLGNSQNQTTEEPVSTSIPSVPGTTVPEQLLLVGDVSSERHGAWAYLPDSSLVIRGVVESERFGWKQTLDEYSIFTVRITDVVVGEFDDAVINIARGAADQTIHEWVEGTEAIFFLVPLRLTWDTWSPDVWVVRFGDATIVEDLDHWATVLPEGSSVLGAVWNAAHRDPETVSMFTELVVEGTVGQISAADDALGAEYSAVDIVDVVELWTEQDAVTNIDGEPTSPTPENLTLRVTPAQAEELAVGERFVFYLEYSTFRGLVEKAWVPIGGTSGIGPAGAEVASRLADLTEKRVERDGLFDSIVSVAGARLDDLVAEYGRIPLQQDGTGTPEDFDREQFYEPLEVVTSTGRVVFDRWFFVLLDGQASATVYDLDDVVVAIGPIDAIMDEVEGGFEFRSEGRSVGYMTYGELDAATRVTTSKPSD